MAYNLPFGADTKDAPFNQPAWTKRDQENEDARIMDLLDEYQEEHHIIGLLETDYGDYDVTEAIKKAMFNAYMLGNFESMTAFAKSFCEEISTRMQARAEKENERNYL